MANDERIEAFRNTLAQCIETPIDDLLTRQALGTLNFEQLREPFEILFDLANSYLKLSLERLPDGIINTLNSTASSVLARVQEIKNFSIEQPSASDIRNKIISNFQNHFEGFFQNAAMWLPYLHISQEDFRDAVERLTNSAENLDTLLAEKEQMVAQKAAEIDKIITAAREASGSAGVGHYTDDFAVEAGKRETSAWYWLVATAIAAIATVAAAVLAFLWLPLPADASTTLIVQHVTTKLIVLGMLFSATIWCGQMYRANKHQAAINRVRANGLKTFQAFVEATSDPQTRDAVLLETTRSIFAHGATGYIDQPNAAEGSGRVIELVRTTAEKTLSE